MFAQVAKAPAKENAIATAAKRKDRAGRSDRAQEPEGLAGEFESRCPNAGTQWDFRKIPILAPGKQPSSPSLYVQRKLTIGAVNDPLEQEADRVAEQVMHIPAQEVSVAASPPKISRKCMACEEQAEEKLQKKEAGTAAAATSEASTSVHEVLRSPGQPLDESTRAFFEPRFGRDFREVRVHTDAVAEQSARDLDALAYTVGRHIVFDAGQYAPKTDTGRRVLAHELTHTVQQSSASMPAMLRVEPSGSAFEPEADRIADWAMSAPIWVAQISGADPALGTAMLSPQGVTAKHDPAHYSNDRLSISTASIARLQRQRRGAAGGCGICMDDPLGSKAGQIAHREVQDAFLRPIPTSLLSLS